MTRISFSPGLWPTLAALLVFPVFIMLGLWQLDRAEQKSALHREYRERESMPAVLLNAASTGERLDAWTWRQAEARGRFDENVQILLDNQTVNGVAGYYVYSPYLVDGQDFWLLVNRGWLAAGPDRTRTPALRYSDETVMIKGVLKPEPSTGMLLAEHAPEQLTEHVIRVQRLSIDELSSLLNRPLAPVIFRMHAGDDHGYRRDWKSPGSGENKHRAYAFQWFSFAALLLFIYIVLNIRKTDKNHD